MKKCSGTVETNGRNGQCNQKVENQRPISFIKSSFTFM